MGTGHNTKVNQGEERYKEVKQQTKLQINNIGFLTSLHHLNIQGAPLTKTGN